MGYPTLNTGEMRHKIMDRVWAMVTRLPRFVRGCNDSPQQCLRADQVHRPHVVIVGGGFAGLEVAKALANAPVDIVLIDRQNYHCFQPLLYQVATAALSPADIAWPIRAILRNQTNARVILAEVTGIDSKARLVEAGSLRISYDYLVLATGAIHSYFGHEEWARVAPGLKQIEDAIDLRRQLLLAFERAEIAESPDERLRLLTVVLVGGGPTGVELAGAIAELARQALPQDFRAIDPRQARIVLLEAGPRILPAFPEPLSAYAKTVLERMGVTVLTTTAVTGCDEKGVDTAAGRIEAGTIIWAAGVRASPAARWLGVPADRLGRIEVTEDLSISDYSNVFAVGDTAFVAAHPVPGLAPAAKQMGRYVGRAIARRVSGAPSLPPFRYRHWGDLATIGRRAAVVRLGRLRLTGFPGWVFWGVAHIYFLIGLKNRFIVALTWLWTYLTHQRGARLITREPSARE